jgi:hypothetical protein
VLGHRVPRLIYFVNATSAGLTEFTALKLIALTQRPPSVTRILAVPAAGRIWLLRRVMGAQPDNELELFMEPVYRLTTQALP